MTPAQLKELKALLDEHAAVDTEFMRCHEIELEIFSQAENLIAAAEERDRLQRTVDDMGDVARALDQADEENKRLREALEALLPHYKVQDGPARREAEKAWDQARQALKEKPNE